MKRRILSWVAVILFITVPFFFLGWMYLPDILKWMGISVSDAKTISDILQSFAQIVAIIIAGLWTYERFIKNREDHPYPTIQHRIEDYDLGNGKVYLSVFVTFKNEGKVKLDLGRGRIHVRQVFPIPEQMDDVLQEPVINKDTRLGRTRGLFKDSSQRIAWVTLGEREWSELPRNMKVFEPGQAREIQFDFLIEDEAKIIEVISNVEIEKKNSKIVAAIFNIKKEYSNWEATTIYTLTSVKVNKRPRR